ncbi:MAG: ATP-binding protein [Isosphaeraceae bacterium]
MAPTRAERVAARRPRSRNTSSRISGPLLDRIDLHVEVPAVPFTQLAEMPPAHLPPNSAPRCSKPAPVRPSGSAPMPTVPPSTAG